jgi:hypothetical protein
MQPHLEIVSKVFVGVAIRIAIGIDRFKNENRFK